MTCRHRKDDPDCSAYESNLKEARELLRKAEPTTPDAARFSIEDAVRVGPHLVLKVLYPNCGRCSYEGNKVMVFLNVTEIQALRWKTIDPHFRKPSNNLADSIKEKEAASPAARFPASEEGWADALKYAASKTDTSRLGAER